MLTISAIVPTCDRPLLLERALRSIIAQKFLPTEIIVVDDAGAGQENVTRLALESCCLTGVRVVANTNAKGVSGARNTGAELATGELLAFLLTMTSGWLRIFAQRRPCSIHRSSRSSVQICYAGSRMVSTVSVKPLRIRSLLHFL